LPEFSAQRNLVPHCAVYSKFKVLLTTVWFQIVLSMDQSKTRESSHDKCFSREWELIRSISYTILWFRFALTAKRYDDAEWIFYVANSMAANRVENDFIHK